MLRTISRGIDSTKGRVSYRVTERIEEIPSHDMIVLTGDYNVSFKYRDEMESAIIGPYMLKNGLPLSAQQLENRTLLLETCDLHNLVIANTYKASNFENHELATHRSLKTSSLASIVQYGILFLVLYRNVL